MTISLLAAQGAVTALSKVDGLQPTEKNKHLFEKHISKQAAIDAGGASISWFEKVENLSFSEEGDAKKLPANRLAKLGKIMNVRNKDIKRTLQRFDRNIQDPYKMQVTNDVGTYGLMEVIKSSLSQPYVLYSNTDGDPVNSFRYICDIPVPYVGRSIVQGTKQKLIGGFVCMIIHADGNARVTTVYPVSATWPQNTTEVVLV